MFEEESKPGLCDWTAVRPGDVCRRTRHMWRRWLLLSCRYVTDASESVRFPSLHFQLNPWDLWTRTRTCDTVCRLFDSDLWSSRRQFHQNKWLSLIAGNAEPPGPRLPDQKSKQDSQQDGHVDSSITFTIIQGTPRPIIPSETEQYSNRWWSSPRVIPLHNPLLSHWLITNLQGDSVLLL